MRLSQGFTLMELMITVAILAILAGIAIPMYSGYVQSGYQTECKNEVSAIKLAEEEYYLKYNQYFPPAPGNVSMLTSDTYPNQIEIASGATATDPTGGTYNSSYDSTTKISQANCTYQVTTATAAPLYTITATGANKLANSGFTYTITK